MAITVRALSEEHVEGAARLVARLKMLNAELDPNLSVVDNLEEEALAYVRESIGKEDIVFLVAYDEEQDRVAGIARAVVVDRRFYKPRRALLITDLYVDPRYRRKRVGTLLIEKLGEEALSRGINVLLVTYPAGNLIADRFYEHRGFRLLEAKRYKIIH